MVLFTSAPVDTAISIISHKLEQDTWLHQRTSISMEHITTLLEFCPTNTYFIFQGKYYEQVHGAAMGSPISSIVANLFIEGFETKAIKSATYPWKLWPRYVDDTFVIQKEDHSIQILQDINFIKPHIHFTKETPDNTLLTVLYRKSTYRDQYLHWDSHHNLSAKYCVFNVSDIGLGQFVLTFNCYTRKRNT